MNHRKVLGTGCANCTATFKLTEQVAPVKDAAIELEKSTTSPGFWATV